MSDSIFEQATRRKLRFAAKAGAISLEDLWDLSLNALDAIAVQLHQQASVSQISFVKKSTPGDIETNLKLEVVKRVIAVKLAEQDARQLAAARAEKRRALEEALAARERNELTSMSAEEIRKQLAELQ